MPIDPRIPMSYQQQPQQQNQFFDWKTLAQMAELRYKQEERNLKTTKAARLADLVRGATTDVDGRKEVDWGVVSSGIAETDPELGLTLGLGQYRQTKYKEEATQATLGTTKSKLQVQEQEIQTNKDLVAFAGQQADAALRGNSQAHYDQGKAEMERVSPGSTAALPPIWGDEAKTRLKEIFDKSQSVKDVMDRQAKALDLQNKDLEKQGKTQDLTLGAENIALRRQQRATEAAQTQNVRLAQEQKRLDLVRLRDEAQARGIQIPEYLKGNADANLVIHSMMQQEGLTGAPPPHIISRAQERLVEPVGDKATREEAKDATAGEQALARRYDTLTSGYRDIRDAWSRVRTMGGQEIPPEERVGADYALVYAFSKMNDPQTGIKEEERKAAVGAGGAPAQVARWMEHVKGNKLLPDDIRNQFVAASQRLYDVHTKTYATIRGSIEEQARRQRLDPRNVIIDYTAPVEPWTMPPAQPPPQARGLFRPMLPQGQPPAPPPAARPAPPQAPPSVPPQAPQAPPAQAPAPAPAAAQAPAPPSKGRVTRAQVQQKLRPGSRYKTLEEAIAYYRSLGYEVD